VTPVLDPWLFWPLLAAAGALLALDDTSLAQTWLSQPLPAALLGGLLVGEPAAGLLPGVLVQLAVVGNMPVGASFRLDQSSAALGLVAGAVLGGWAAPARPLGAAAWTGPAAAGVGLLVVAIVLASLLGGRLVHLEWRARLGWMLDGYRSVRDGELGRLERLQARCLAVTAARGAVLTVAWTMLARAAWAAGPAAWPSPWPHPWQQTLALVPWLVPALAVGTMLERFGPRRSLPWVGGAALVGLALTWTAAGG